MENTIKGLELIEFYCKDELNELRKICDPIILRKGLNLSRMECDELYSLAMDTLMNSANKYNPSQNCSFKTFLTGNIMRTFYDWTRDSRRGKRCNLERNKDGTIKKDEEDNPIVIKNKSLDETADDGIDLNEKVSSCFDVFEQVLGGDIRGTKIEKYLSRLSSLQRDVVRLLADGYIADEIREQLHITKKQYTESIMAIQAYENTRYLL